MIDGIKSLHPYLHPDTWQRSGLLGYSITVNEDTGEVLNDARIAVYKGLRFEIRPAVTGQGYTCILNGSLHKCYNNGEHNANDFPFAALVDIIWELSKAFDIVPDKATLHGLEIGINIKLPFSPLRVFKQILCYKNKPFTQIDKRNKRLGLVCCLTDYDIKLYDKQAQSGQSCGYVLRFEIKIKKMRYLKPYCIISMADLTNMGKMYSLLNILTDVLQSIVFFDYAIDQKKLSKRELSQYLVLGNPVYWETMSKYQLTRNRSRLNDLLTSHSKQHLKPLLNGLLIEGWNGLFTGYPEAENLQPFHQLSESHNRHKNATFSHLEYIGEKVAGKNSNKLQENEQEIKGTTLLNISKEYENIYSAKNAQKQSYCKSCGRDVSDQRPGSLFCSERIYGRIAKACRNKNSNRRRDLKRIISKAMSIQNFIAVTYQIGIQTYTDTLHPSELDVTKKWLDRITRIDILPTARGEKPETLMGNKAKEYVQSITNKKQ